MGKARTSNIAPYGHLDTNGFGIANMGFVFPGVRGKLKKSIRIDQHTTLKAGTKVIIQPLNRESNDTPKFKLTPYRDNKTSKRSNQPESHRDIITEQSHEVTLASPSDYLSFNNEHYRRRDEPLFPHADSPSLSDINQARIPDCFLLAAIQSILNHPNGKAFIRGMFQQHSDGTTTVRLYDQTTLKPHYVRIENSVIVDSFGELNLHGGLWVHMLEKAYAAFNTKKSKDETVDASVSSVFSEGGHADTAFKIMTGINARYISTAPSLNPLDIEAFLGEANVSMLNLLLGTQDIQTEILANFLSVQLSPKHLETLNQLFTPETALTQYIELLKCHHADPDAFKKAIEERNPSLIKKTHTTAATILSEVYERQKAFSGIYSAHALSIYDTLQSGLAEGKLLTASTPTKISSVKPLGVSERHAYSILGVFEKDIKVKDKETGEIKTIKTKFIRLRNPWGDLDGFLDSARQFMTGGIGRIYVQHEDTLEILAGSDNSASFFVELNEFCRYFSSYRMSDSVNDRFSEDAEKEQCMHDIQRFYEDFHIDFTSSTSELLEAHQQHNQLVKQLVEFEMMHLKLIDAQDIEDINKIFSEQHPDTLEHMAVTGLLDPSKFPSIPGNEEDILNHLYALLKLNWLVSQDNRDHNLESELTKTIQKSALLAHSWQQLNEVEVMLNVITMVRAKQSHSLAEQIDAIIKTLEQDQLTFLASLTGQRPVNPDEMNMLQQKIIMLFMKLEELYLQLLNASIVTQQVHRVNPHDEALQVIATKIEELTPFVQEVKDSQPHFQSLWKMRAEIREQASDMAKKHEITEAEHAQIKQATQHIFSGEMKSVGKRLTASPSEKKVALGEKMIEADTLAQKIKRGFARFGAFLSRIGNHISTFFHTKNSYEIPSLFTDTPTPTP